MQAAIRIPEPSDNDPDSVATALETAALLVAKGELAEALRWVRRGAESASETGHDVRALALARAAAELSDQLERPSGFAPAASRVPEPAAPNPPPAPPPSSRRPPLQGKPVVAVSALNPAYSVARPANAPRIPTAASEATTAPPPADYRFDRRSAPPKAPPPKAFDSGAYSTLSQAHAAPSAPAAERPAQSSPFAERPSPSAPAAERPVEHPTSSYPPASISSYPPPSTSSFPPPGSASDAPPRPRAALRKTARVAVRSAGGTQYVVRTLEEDESLDPGEQEGLLVLLEPKSRLF